MKKISRRSFLAAAAVSVAALALTACGGSASTASSAAASSVAASSEAASTSAAAAELTTVEAGKLTMATNATFPPYEMTTDAGTIEGIDVDTAQAIAEKLGLELQIDDMDFDAALLSVQQGKADIAMAGITVTDERMAVMSFSDSYATGIQSIIVPEGSDIASPDDLAGKKIGTQRGTTYNSINFAFYIFLNILFGNLPDITFNQMSLWMIYFKSFPNCFIKFICNGYFESRTLKS